MQSREALRIRLEGRLEVLESASKTLESLERILSSGNFARDPAAALRHLQDWESSQSRLGEAIDAAQRADGSDPVARINRAKAALDAALKKHFANSSIGRADTLSRRLELLRQLVESTGQPARTEKPLAEAVVSQRTPYWIGIVALTVAMLIVRQYWPAMILVFVAAFARELVRSDTRYRLFHDVLVRDRRGETLVLPLTSFDSFEAVPGQTFQGLVDLELGEDEQFVALCAKIKQLKAERAVLRTEETSLARLAGPAGRWLAATLEPDSRGQPEAVEVLAFPKGASGGPVEMRARRGATAGPKIGLALLCDRGLLFIPLSTEQAVREVLLDTERVEMLSEQQRALKTFPAELILDHLEELRRIVGVQWCDVHDAVVWTSVSAREEVDLPSGRLSVTTDDEARAALRRLWP